MKLGFRVVQMLLLVAVLWGGRVHADEVRGMYMATYDFASTNQATVQSAIDNAINKVVTYNMNALYLQVRPRADAYYIPNRNNSRYPNPEPRAQAYSLPSGFDPLQYAIEKGHEKGIKVHAWMVVFPTWSSSTNPSSASHVKNAHPEWLTTDAAGSPSTYISGSLCSLDPGIPAVQDYLTNVFLDVVSNYDIDGVHFDYSRLPENGRTAGEWSKFGYNPLSLAQFTAETGLTYNPSSDTAKVQEVYQQWMREQVDNLAKRIWTGTKKEKPWVQVSSFVINFEDSPDALAQSYNMWTNRGHFDYIAGGNYVDTNPAGGATYMGYVDSSWTRESNYVKVPGTSNLSRPILFTPGANSDPTYGFGNTVDSVKATVNDIRSKSPAASGFIHFDYGGLIANSDQLLHALADAGGPYATAAAYPAQSVLNALTPADTVAPNAPASASATAANPAYSVQVSFSRPAAASDGNYPVEYRIYRDSQASVREYYSNLRMVFWDENAARSSFNWTDNSPLSGNNYYKIVAYDRWHNAASANVGPVSCLGGEIIIESRSGGKNYNLYTDAGMTGDSTAKSTAVGVTSGIGCRYSTNVSITASATFSPGRSGNFDLYVTCPSATTTNAPNTSFQVTGTAVSGTVPLVYNGSAANSWYKFASNVVLTPSSQIIFREVSPQTDRLVMDAVRLVPTGSTPWETKPLLYSFPQNFTPGSSVIVDDGAGLGGTSSELNLLNYDDGTGWLTSTYGTNYGPGNYSRYAQNANKANKAVFSLDLPVDGQYDLKAYITNAAYTTTAKYQFRAYANSSFSALNTYTVNASQASRPTGFSIDADGQASDAASYWFKAGKLLVAVWDDSGSAATLRADAFKATLVSTGSQVADWSMY